MLAALTTVLVSVSGTAAGLSERLAPGAKVAIIRLRIARRAGPEAVVRPRPARRLARRLSRCQARQLDVQFGSGGQTGADATQVVTFLNASHRACMLEGYPELHLDGPHGSALATHQHNGYLYAVPEHPVQLDQGRTASFGVAYPTKTGGMRCPRSASVDIRPPGAGAAIGVGWKIAPYGGTVRRPRCGVVLVSPVYAGSGAPPQTGIPPQIRSTSGLSGSSADLAGYDQHTGGRGLAHRGRLGLVDLRGGRAPHRPVPA